MDRSDHAPAAAVSGLRPSRLTDASRLQAVENTGLLDSPTEPAFDALTALAARLLGVPAVFLSVLASDRDFYKSHCGFSGELARSRTLRGRSFCHLMLDVDRPLVIRDTWVDPVHAQVPSVVGLGVRAYAGMPLRSGGHIIGALCAIDMRPRDWSAHELEVLAQLAASAQREIDLRSALERARLLAREREELLATVAHDLRTPMQVLSMSLDVIERTSSLETLEGRDRTMQRMRQSLQAMRQLTDTLMQVQCSPSHEPLRADRLASDVVMMMTPLAERRGHALSLGLLDDLSVMGDYGQLLRVLANLVGNAIKYCDEGSQIRVDVRRDPQARAEGMQVCLEVVDNGPGIAPEAQAHVFERGWQGADGLSRDDSAGLGLAIVREVVEAHGGQVTLTSAPGQGTRVCVRLPQAHG